MSVWGADVAGLQAIAMDLERYADSVEQARQNVDAQLARTAWEGPTADGFRSRWRTMALRDLTGFQQDLTAAASDLRRQAQEQLDASSVRGGGVNVGELGRSAGAALAGAGPLGTGMLGAGLTAAGLAALGVAIPGVAGAALTATDLARQGLPPALVRALAAPAALVQGSPTIDRERVAEATKAVSVLTSLGMMAIGSTHTSTMVIKWGAGEALSSDFLYVNAVSNTTLQVAGDVLTFGSAAITGGFAQWNADIGGDFSTPEQVTRATAVGATQGSIALGTKIGVTAAAAPFVGPAAPLVGMAASAAVTYGLQNTEVGQAFSSGVADVASQGVEYGRQAREGFGMMGDAATQVWDDTSTRVMDTAGDMVSSAGDVLDSVGGGVQDAVSSTVDRLNPFSWR